MFISYLRTVCTYLTLLFISVTATAEIYKWTDEKGQVHYSERAPADQKTEIIPPPPPPVEDPATAQKRVDTLIESQNQEIKDLNNAKLEASDKAAHDERCQRAKLDLQKFIARPPAVYRESRTVVRVESEAQREAEYFRLRDRVDEVCVPYQPPVPPAVTQPVAEPETPAP